LLIVGLAASSVLASAGTALAYGGKPTTLGAKVTPFTCAPDNSSHTTSWTADTVYYVNATGGVNVRNGPGTGYCIVTSQGYTADVVAVPNTATVNANGYTWIKVAYYEGNCQTCTNYSWSQTGWMAINFLTKMSSGFECVESAGCALYFVDSSSGYPYPSSYDPNLSQSQCSASSSPMPCEWHANGYNSTISPPSTQYTLKYGAYDGNPNWFAYLYSFKDGSFEGDYYWNYDWWAH
jgi:hypothetical protein